MWPHETEAAKVARMAYNETCPMVMHLPKWVRIAIAWKLG